MDILRSTLKVGISHSIYLLSILLLLPSCSPYVTSMIYENKIKPTPYRIPEYSPKPLSWKADQITFSWLGHSTVLLNVHGTTILTDPAILKRIGPPEIWNNFFGVRRIAQLPLRIEDIPKIDIILISHSHFDHLCKSSLKKLYSLRNRNACLIGPLKSRKLLEKTGFSNIVELDWQKSVSVKNVRIKAFKAEHYVRVEYGDREEIKRANGYMISSDGIRIAFLGDTAYRRYRNAEGVRLSQPEEVDWQKEVNPEGGEIDLCIIPIGDSHYRINHAGPDDAVKLFEKIKGKKFLPVHYNTFILSSPDEEPDSKQMLLKSLKRTKMGQAVFFETPDHQTVFPDIGAECMLSGRQDSKEQSLKR